MEYDGQTFYDGLESPGSHPVHLALPIPTAFDEGSTRIDQGMTVKPLLSQHGDKWSKEGSAQTQAT